jgi:hypothetical protein
MLSRKHWVTVTLLAILLRSSTVSAQAVEPTAASSSTAANHKLTSADDVHVKRNQARHELMVTSLKGLRGIAFGVVHADNATELEATMAKRLKQLDIPIHPFSSLKTGIKPVDGLVEVKILKVPTANYVQLNLIQWVSLLRQPKAEVRAVTYHDALLSADADLNKTVDDLTNQFVIDVLKANQQAPTAVAKEKLGVHRKVQ